MLVGSQREWHFSVLENLQSRSVKLPQLEHCRSHMQLHTPPSSSLPLPQDPSEGHTEQTTSVCDSGWRGSSVTAALAQLAWHFCLLQGQGFGGTASTPGTLTLLYSWCPSSHLKKCSETSPEKLLKLNCSLNKELKGNNWRRIIYRYYPLQEHIEYLAVGQFIKVRKKKNPETLRKHHLQHYPQISVKCDFRKPMAQHLRRQTFFQNLPLQAEEMDYP